MAGLVPVGVRRPLVACEARGLFPLLRASWTDPRRVEGVPPAMAARIAIPPIVLLGFPAAARAPDTAIVRDEKPLLEAGRAAADQKSDTAEGQEELDHDFSIA